MDFRKLVTDKIALLGVKESSKFFGVSAGTVSNWSSGKTSPSLEAVELCMDGEIPVPPVPDTLTQWEGKDVIILLPVYRSLCADTHFTLFANYAKYGADKIGLIQEKRTVIHESRNILSHKFLKTNATYAIMVDDDMVLPCGSEALFNNRYGAGVSPASASYNAISRIMSHGPDKEIVGALYFGRKDKGKAQCARGFSNDGDNADLHAGKHSGLIKDDWVGTGMIRIHRSVFEKMAKEVDNGKWPECNKSNTPDAWYGFFNPTHAGVGEDVSFGRRAQEIGIQTYVDAGLVCLHVGERFYGPKNTK